MDSNERQDQAAEIQAAMDRLNWSAATLAEKAHTSKNTITSVLRGNQAQPGTLRKLRAALGIQPRTVTDEAVGYDADVETISLAVKVWLADLPRDERPEAVAALFAAVVTFRDARNKKGPNG